ncbi:NAD-dependent epimerase/dehydratase family protein [Sphingomonas sp. LY160]|uniref:NAD-dependent epimerase/dehydratase family protein n=1 Tax=Sphingomonas sp. LY160 TaxID=3095342 RepID=UPI002ADEDFAB|nr:NAD-dependent epimerase/dehydratase family protein [Sphingomonas sp. LY160]MEA1071040.1 GDP-mannose 4,6-dehydratase [Sphingomonas sp. LY160]
MTILVTGVAGFIGSTTARALLARGETVIGIDNLNDYYDVTLKHARLARLQDEGGDRFTFEAIDFAEIDDLNAFAARHDFDRIVHLGAQAGVRHSIDKPHAYVRSNLLGHLNMLELARARQPKHMVYASSSSVYGGNDTLPFRVEDRTDHPLSLYAASKRADELMSESYANLFRTPLTGLRFFTVYGPWGRPDMAMWLFTKALYAGEPLRLFNAGKMRRDFTYVDDIVRGIIACLDGPPADDGSEKAGGSTGPHALYNIGNHRSEDLMRVVELLQRETGREAKIDFQPMQPGDVSDTFADISAIQRDHGFEPATTIDEGVPNFVAWYRDYHRLD